MPIVPYGTTVPTLTPLQFNFNGFTFGGIAASDTYQFVSAKGLDSPPVVSGDTQRPQNSGEFAGSDFNGPRDLVIVLVFGAASAAAFDTARVALGANFQAQGNGETPLFFQTGGGTTYGCMARWRKNNWTYDLNMVEAFGGLVTIAFHCKDWRMYSTPTLQVATTFSATAEESAVVVAGEVNTNPLLVITAGASGCSPLITSADVTLTSIVGNGSTATATTATPHGLATGASVSIAGNSVAGFNLGALSVTVTGASTFTFASTVNSTGTGGFVGAGNSLLIDFTALAMASGDVLSIDTDYQTAAWFDSSAGVTSSAKNSIAFPPNWGPIAPNKTTTLIVSDQSGGGGTSTLDVQYASAFGSI